VPVLHRAIDGKLREIVRLGHPALRARADEVPAARFGTRMLRDLGRDLVRTMHDNNGVGLAAPQIAVPLRVFAYYVPKDDAEEEVAARVLVNPVLHLEGAAEELGWEGCLSVPGLRGLVPRHERLTLRALDIEGLPIEVAAAGFHARVIQHEYDHLDGVIFVDRMRDLGSLAFEEEWERYALDREQPVEA
jgi:peptide deformylase